MEIREWRSGGRRGAALKCFDPWGELELKGGGAVLEAKYLLSTCLVGTYRVLGTLNT